MKTIQQNQSLAVEIKGIRCPNKIVAVENFKQASEAVQQYISFFNLSGSTFKGAIIFHSSKGAFAHVSYNGRVWKGGNSSAFKSIEIKELSLSDF